MVKKVTYLLGSQPYPFSTIDSIVNEKGEEVPTITFKVTKPESHYVVCEKCGRKGKVIGGIPTMCTNEFPGRTSGICGGRYKEITEIEYFNE